MSKISIFSLVIFILLSIWPELGYSQKLFEEVETVQIKLDHEWFTGIHMVRPTKNGFVICLTRSRSANMMAVIDSMGEQMVVYDKDGNGPGELRHLTNVVVTERGIYACEGQTPFIHLFNHELKFVKDYRIKRAGHLYPLDDGSFGIWGPNYLDEGIYNLAVYDRDFKFKKYALPIKEVPALFQSWGGIVFVNENTFAVVRPPHYQISLFEKDLNHRTKLIQKTPPYIKPYQEYKKSPSIVNEEIVKWSKSWSVVHSLFYVNGYYILKIYENDGFFLDIYDSKGNLLRKSIKEELKYQSIFVDGEGFLWKLKTVEKEEFPEYFLKKVKLKF